ncbi:CTP synthase 1 isoform X2 [Cryptotermes secundus]|nr:CTP synthase 1 isoform X2 [Cryptotermes secundus]
MKYILVTGGVISGVGKGVIASSFGTILKCSNIHVTSIKIDPYINIDAGTFSPYEHGEVYVLDDGGEVDLDLGNYERFLDITLHRDNNITTGKIYQHVISKERRGDFLGKTVQVVPHITDAIQEWVEKVANQPVTEDGTKPQVCIVELGGTIGDIEGMPFVEAFRQFQFRVKKENFVCAHVSMVPQVLCIHDLPSIYRVPILMQSQGILEFFNDRLQLNIPMPPPRKFMYKWKDLAERADTLCKDVTIALVGKYTKLEDSYASVTKALQHAALAAGLRLKIKYIEAANLEDVTRSADPVSYHEAWQQFCKSDGVIVPGGFGKRGVDGKIEACKWCRETKKPFLGICLGLQTAVIEFSRNVLNLTGANTTEIDPDAEHAIVIDMPEYNPGMMGSTMRLGKRTTVFAYDNSVLKQLYGNKERIEERHRHRYEVNPKYVPQLEVAGMKFVGRDEENIRMEILELDDHPYFVATQYHPEYLSRPLKPSPPFFGLILASVGKLHSYLARGCRLTPRQLSDVESDDEIPETVMKDNIVISNEMLTEGKSKSVGSSS